MPIWIKKYHNPTRATHRIGHRYNFRIGGNPESSFPRCVYRAGFKSHVVRLDYECKGTIPCPLTRRRISPFSRFRAVLGFNMAFVLVIREIGIIAQKLPRYTTRSITKQKFSARASVSKHIIPKFAKFWPPAACLPYSPHILLPAHLEAAGIAGEQARIFVAATNVTLSNASLIS